MKLVDRKTFLTLPAGTLYQKYEPSWCEHLEIKINNVNDNDWASLTLDAIALCPGGDPNEVNEILDSGKPFRMDFSNIGRDGAFEENKIFMIWEKKDIKDLIDILVHDCL